MLLDPSRSAERVSKRMIPVGRSKEVWLQTVRRRGDNNGNSNCEISFAELSHTNQCSTVRLETQLRLAVQGQSLTYVQTHVYAATACA